jgi:hypothetical protein
MSRNASAEGADVEDCIVNPQQRLNFWPLLHGQGAFRPIFGICVRLHQATMEKHPLPYQAFCAESRTQRAT